MEPPNGREVFVFGNGAWIDFEPERSKRWLRDVESAVKTRLPAFMETKAKHRVPKLFVTPNAQGVLKPPLFSQAQNNLAIMRMEHEMSDWTGQNGYDFLGFYNATVQAHSPDGTHGSMETNLLKAMMILNWLHALDPDA